MFHSTKCRARPWRAWPSCGAASGHPRPVHQPCECSCPIGRLSKDEVALPKTHTANKNTNMITREQTTNSKFSTSVSTAPLQLSFTHIGAAAIFAGQGGHQASQVAPRRLSTRSRCRAWSKATDLHQVAGHGNVQTSRRPRANSKRPLKLLPQTSRRQDAQPSHSEVLRARPARSRKYNGKAYIR
jgi:hypothetical protein